MDPDQVLFDDLELKDERGGDVPRVHRASHDLSLLRRDGLMSSVYLAEGLHHDGRKEEELPSRFAIGSNKAKIKWFGALCVTGIGMFVEAFVIITTGQLKTVWHDAYPTCFVPHAEMQCPDLIQCCGLFPNTPDTCDTNTEMCQADGTYKDKYLCNPAVISSLSYIEFAGIMLGMLLFGKLADLVGHQPAGILAALLQVAGILFMTFYHSHDLNTMFIVFDAFYGVFGLGIGGEYPLTAATAAAHHADSSEEALLDSEERHRVRVLRDKARSVRRGETIALAFAMQGVGAVVGSIFLLCLIFFGDQQRVNCNAQGHMPSGAHSNALSGIWRTFYFIGFIFVAMVLVYRGLIQEEGSNEKLLARKQKRREKLGKKLPGTWKLLKFYGPRLIGTGGAWFAWDIAFYGLKLFSGPIFDSINPTGDLATNNSYILINNLCALVGYYAAAYVIDIPAIGRLRLQVTSFLICAILFLITGAIFNTASPQLLLFLYFISSFFGQLGPNVTTYVMAAETYPTELRGTCHGISAFLGKAGALLATIVFSHMTSPQIFFVCGGTGILGALFTFFFCVDLTHVSLAEHDVQLELFLEGRLDEYKGKLNHKKHLSFFERITGRHGQYECDWARDFVTHHSRVVEYSDKHSMEEQVAQAEDLGYSAAAAVE